MSPKFMRNLHNKKKMLYRNSWDGIWAIALATVCLLAVYLLVAWIDESAEVAKKETIIALREGQMVAMMEEHTMATGDGHYVLCRKSSLVRGIKSEQN